MKKKTPTKTKRIGVPRPMLAMATPPNDRPLVSIDRLKGGEINWSIRAPAATLRAAIERAMEEARPLVLACIGLEEHEKALRTALAHERAQLAEKAAARAKEQEEEAKGNRKENGK